MLSDVTPSWTFYRLKKQIAKPQRFLHDGVLSQRSNAGIVVECSAMRGSCYACADSSQSVGPWTTAIFRGLYLLNHVGGRNHEEVYAVQLSSNLSRKEGRGVFTKPGGERDARWEEKKAAKTHPRTTGKRTKCSLGYRGVIARPWLAALLELFVARSSFLWVKVVSRPVALTFIGNPTSARTYNIWRLHGFNDYLYTHFVYVFFFFPAAAHRLDGRDFSALSWYSCSHLCTLRKMTGQSVH